MARSERLTVGGSEMELYVDEPAGAGPHPAVLVAHHRGALDAFTRKFVEDLARNGYVAAAPLFYHRRPAGEDSMTSLRNLDDGGRIAELQALYVLPGARGVGVGETLMKAVLAWAEASGAEGVDSVALPGDRATKNFFEQFGLKARAILVHRSLGG